MNMHSRRTVIAAALGLGISLTLGPTLTAKESPAILKEVFGKTKDGEPVKRTRTD
jgi:hypothetical protein